MSVTEQMIRHEYDAGTFYRNFPTFPRFSLNFSGNAFLKNLGKLGKLGNRREKLKRVAKI